MPTPVDGLLQDAFEIFIEDRDEPLLELLARGPDRKLPESVRKHVTS